MEELFTLESLVNLGVLVFLQAVLGFDNLLYVSIESKRENVRYLHIHEDDRIDDRKLARWLRQASELPGEELF